MQSRRAFLQTAAGAPLIAMTAGGWPVAASAAPCGSRCALALGGGTEVHHG